LEHAYTDRNTGTMNPNASEVLLSFIPPTLLDALMVSEDGKKVSLLAFMQGNDGKDNTGIKPYWERDLSDRNVVGDNNGENNFVNKTLASAMEIKKLLDSKELIIGDLVKTGPMGDVRVDWKKLEENVGKAWHTYNKTFGSGSFDYDTKISVDGKEVTLFDSMFGEKTRETFKVMKSYYEKMSRLALSSEERALYGKYAKALDSNPAPAVFMSILAQQISEHTKYDAYFKPIDVNDVATIAWVLKKFIREADIKWDGDVPTVEQLGSVIPEKLFKEILGVYGVSIGRLWIREIFYVLLITLLSAPSVTAKEIGNMAGMVLGDKK
jgi:hypothetical protein